MAWTQAQLDALETAIAQGSKRVRYDDKEIEYRSLEEMLLLRNAMRSSLGEVSPATGRIFTQFSKGV